MTTEPKQPEAATIEAIGEAFVQGLKECLTVAQWEAMQADNAAEPEGSTVCHSHDYLDANEVMMEAFAENEEQTCAEFEDGTPEHEAACLLWNAAWAYATAKYLKGAA